MRAVFLLLLALISLGFGVPALAENTSHGIIHPDFATLQVTLNDNPRLPAVLVQGSADRLVIEFDELSAQARNLRWSVVHCDASWQPEGLADIEYTDGMNESRIEDYEYSRGTLTHYVHYRIVLPDADVPLKLSGNYLLRVYEEYEPDEVLLQVRFAVAEASARISAQVSPRTDIDYLASHQQLEISVETRGSGIVNPYTDLRTVVTQNGTDFSSVTLTTPSAVQGSNVIYSHLRPLIFDGGNEYRRFETVSTSYPGMGVDVTGHDGNGYHAALYIDTPRGNSGYRYDSTQHGGFTIREYNSSNPATEAEYILTHFALESPRISGAEVYIDGDLTGNRLDSASRMTYNDATGRYEKTLLLKQGAYDYRYVAVPAGGGKPDMSYTEGNFCDTSNDYTISVYYCRPGERYDRLAAAAQITTVNQRK